jgi:hypothetical protein
MRKVRSFLSSTCFAIGAVWAVAAVMKMTFGTEITFLLLPPLALEKVEVTRSLLVALVCFGAGALLKRYAPSADKNVRVHEPSGPQA